MSNPDRVIRSCGARLPSDGVTIRCQIAVGLLCRVLHAGGGIVRHCLTCRDKVTLRAMEHSIADQARHNIRCIRVHDVSMRLDTISRARPLATAMTLLSVSGSQFFCIRPHRTVRAEGAIRQRPTCLCRETAKGTCVTRAGHRPWPASFLSRG